MFSLVLSKKPNVISEYLGVEIVDLAAPTFTIPDRYGCDVLSVEAGFIGRPDLITDEVYGDDMYTDLIMKLNGVSNAIELNELDYLVLPEANSLEQFIMKPFDWENSKKNSSSRFEPSSTKGKSTGVTKTTKNTDKRFNIDVGSKTVVY